MINPYLPNMHRIQSAYEMIKPEKEIEERRRASLTHPYKTEEEVLRELARDESRANDIFAKMSHDLRNNPDAMLKFIKESEVAYLYVSPNINTLEFKQRALEQNPSVYGMLSNQDRANPTILQSYLNGMVNGMQRRQIDATEYAYQFTQQLNSNANMNQIFSSEVYDNAFRRMILNGPYENHALSRDFTIIATARLLSPEMQQQYDEIERNAWLQNPQAIDKLAYDDRRLLRVDYALAAIEERCPEYKPVIEKKQKEYWGDRKNELLELQDRQNDGVRLNGEELGLLREAQNHIELRKEEKRSQQRVERAREDEIAYFKRDAVERAYGAAANGDISLDQAHDIAAYVGNAPSQAEHGRATEHIASIEAKVNDIDNRDEDRDMELEGLDKTEEIVREEIEEYEEFIEEIEEIEEEEPEYVPWNYSPPDVERFQEYQPH